MDSQSEDFELELILDRVSELPYACHGQRGFHSEPRRSVSLQVVFLSAFSKVGIGDTDHIPKEDCERAERGTHWPQNGGPSGAGGVAKTSGE
jgi:hypothetical protein